MKARALLASCLVVAAACDRTPAPVKSIAASKLPAARAYAAQISKECASVPMTGQPSDQGPLGVDPDVLNVQVSCQRIANLPPILYDPFRPGPPGNHSSATYAVGVSTNKDPDPIERVDVPSWLSTEPGALDLVVAVDRGKPSYAQVRIAFRAPK